MPLGSLTGSSVRGALQNRFTARDGVATVPPMAGTGVVIDRRYLDHQTGAGHPERPERIAVLLPMIEAAADLTRVPARPASGDELALVHDGAYVEEVAETEHKPWFAFDADTPTSPESYATARLAAGGFLALLDAIMSGAVRNGFAFVRPARSPR